MKALVALATATVAASVIAAPASSVVSTPQTYGVRSGTLIGPEQCREQYYQLYLFEARKSQTTRITVNDMFGHATATVLRSGIPVHTGDMQKRRLAVPAGFAVYTVKWPHLPANSDFEVIVKLSFKAGEYGWEVCQTPAISFSTPSI